MPHCVMSVVRGRMLQPPQSLRSQWQEITGVSVEVLSQFWIAVEKIAPFRMTRHEGVAMKQAGIPRQLVDDLRVLVLELFESLILAHRQVTDWRAAGRNCNLLTGNGALRCRCGR